jgi:hypothetical protein
MSNTLQSGKRGGERDYVHGTKGYRAACDIACLVMQKRGGEISDAWRTTDGTNTTRLRDAGHRTGCGNGDSRCTPGE